MVNFQEKDDLIIYELVQILHITSSEGNFQCNRSTIYILSSIKTTLSLDLQQVSTFQNSTKYFEQRKLEFADSTRC